MVTEIVSLGKMEVEGSKRMVWCKVHRLLRLFPSKAGSIVGNKSFVNQSHCYRQIGQISIHFMKKFKTCPTQTLLGFFLKICHHLSLE